MESTCFPDHSCFGFNIQGGTRRIFRREFDPIAENTNC
jgi:hypothetical protein